MPSFDLTIMIQLSAMSEMIQSPLVRHECYDLITLDVKGPIHASYISVACLDELHERAQRLVRLGRETWANLAL